MLPRKFAFLFLTLIVLLAIALYFPRTTAAQSEVERLIPLSDPPERQKYHKHFPHITLSSTAELGLQLQMGQRRKLGIPRALNPRLLRMHGETLE